MNPEVVVANVIEMLKPVLTAGAISAASTTGKELAQMLLKRLQNKALESKDLQNTLKSVEESNGDTPSMDELRKRLLLEISKDKLLRKDLIALISDTTINNSYSSKSKRVSATRGGIAIGGNMTGDIHITNDADNAS